MGKTKENPRYAVVTTRLDDEHYDWIARKAAENNSTVCAVMEAIVRQVRRLSDGV